MRGAGNGEPALSMSNRTRTASGVGNLVERSDCSRDVCRQIGEIKQTLTKLAESYHKLVEEVDRIADLKGKLQAVRDLEKLE